MAAQINALQQTARREKIHDAQIVVKLPASVKELIEKIGADQGTSAASIHRAALGEYLERRGYGE